MDTYAQSVIRALGGTTAVANAIKAPISTVHSWKTNGIPESRLEHLKLVALARKVALPERVV